MMVVLVSQSVNGPVCSVGSLHLWMTVRTVRDIVCVLSVCPDDTDSNRLRVAVDVQF